MQEIEIKDLITLDDNNKYVVVSKTNYNEKNYYYLIDIKQSKNIKFCYFESDEMIEITNKELITELLPLFYENAKNMLNN